MNTNQLKRFAQETRRKLLSMVEAKLNYVLSADSAQLRDKAEPIKNLQEAISKKGKDQVIDAVAYTWFNRLVALRFMDVNGYEPIGLSIVSPADGATLPQILQEAKAGNIPNELTVDRQRVFDLISGKITVPNPQDEAYKELLVATCNQLHNIFPFLFERINDYSELLLPDNLLAPNAIIDNIVQEMSKEDCQEVEILGWLYQFYISEKKDEVFANKGKVNKEDIPAATQLFTPRWIVEYMVQNTVGKLWLQNNPHSKLKEYMPYYIESTEKEENFLQINSVEEITLLDPACGSGHILVYGFELLTKIYEEEGYNQSEIPSLIIEKNLYGFEIDDRAAQLAGLALMLKARQYYRRAFRKNITPNILCFQDLLITKEEIKNTFKQLNINLSEKLLYDLNNIQQATNLGSLIIPQTDLTILQQIADKLKNNSSTSDIFLNKNIALLYNAINQLIALAKKYHCVVANPPYMGGGNMNKTLGDFVKTNYPDSKTDLMACFMEAGLAMLYSNGFLGMINQHSWMFLSSYEKLREKLINTIHIDTLLHLGARTFPEIGGEVVQNSSFTLLNTQSNHQGKYIRLVDENTTELKRDKTLQAIQNPDCGWFYTTSQQNFKKIPGSPIGYWLSENWLRLFDENKTLNEVGEAKVGLQTADNNRFLRFWSEVVNDNIKFNADNAVVALESTKKWFPYNKAGEKRKWWGNQDYLVNWLNDGFEIKNFYDTKGKLRSRPQNSNYYFKKALSWGLITSGGSSFRVYPKGFIYDVAGMSYFPNQDERTFLGFFNTKLIQVLTKVLNPTINLQIGDVVKLPALTSNNNQIDIIVDTCVNISKQEWNSRETSWDFMQNELLRIGGQDIEEAYDAYCQYWQKQFYQLHQNEEELNREFISIYGLQEELTPDVPLDEITLQKDEVDSNALKKIAATYHSGWQLVNGEWEINIEDKTKPQLPFSAKEVVQQFISYAVGCMFGRYSLDKQGLILANQGETLQDYLQKVALTQDAVSYLPDNDNIVPILDNEWFEDDIVTRFKSFVKVCFGAESLSQNIAFIEEALGKDIRKYFIRDFYADHIKRYKKRPIYWCFASPSGAFSVLIYMHRYTPDTLNQILNGYLKDYKEKLQTEIERQEHIKNVGTAREQTIAQKEQDKIRKILVELQEYERELYKMATERISIDLDDGVLVNYNKFGSVIKEVSGLNDKTAKNKVKKFDWIDTLQIR